MKYKIITGLSILLGLAVPAGSLANASIISSGYSYTKMMNLWTDLKFDHDLEASLYEMDEPPQTAPEPAPRFDDPWQQAENLCFDPLASGCDAESVHLMLQPATNQQESTIHRLQIYPVAAQDRHKLVQRRAKLSVFINRFANFNAGILPADSSINLVERSAAIITRYRSSIAEAFLVNLRLYFAEAELTRKCSYIKQADRYSRLLDSFATDADYHSQGSWGHLVSTAQSYSRTYGAMMDEQEVCQVRPARTAAEMRRYLEALIKERLETLAADEIRTLGALMDSSSAKLNSKVSELKEIAIPSKKIMELKRKLLNTRANLLMVEGDMLLVGEALGNEDEGLLLEANQNFATLTDAAQVGPIPGYKERLDSNTAEMTTAFAHLKLLAESTKIPQEWRSSLIPCAKPQVDFTNFQQTPRPVEITADGRVSELDSLNNSLNSCAAAISNIATEINESEQNVSFYRDLEQIIDAIAE